MEDLGARSFGEEGGDLVNHVGGDAFGHEGGTKGAGVDSVKTCLEVAQECRGAEFRPFEGPDLMSEGQAGIKGLRQGRVPH